MRKVIFQLYLLIKKHKHIFICKYNMEFIDLLKAQTLFIITDERKILYNELFKLFNKEDLINKLKIFCSMNTFKYYNNDFHVMRFNLYTIIDNEIFFIEQYMKDKNLIYIFDYEKLPLNINNNVCNIIIYDKLYIPNNIMKLTTYIIHENNIFDDFVYHENKKQKLADNIFQEKYKIFKIIINTHNNNILYDNPYII